MVVVETPGGLMLPIGEPAGDVRVPEDDGGLDAKRDKGADVDELTADDVRERSLSRCFQF